MAGNTLEELFKGVGLEQGTVKAERHGRTAGSIIDKIENKCKADIEVLDEAIKKASGVIPTTIKSKTGKEYKPRFMWGAAGGGRRQINFMDR
jgi:hypothetical protein